ncbi:host specificity factor TipJ family phage tail protein [Escherichia coli]|nr:host specificity factor TipJ family phage tail protein [Escherichia coli]MDB7244519.1 host specificity factor TipJ family phage tail protein [Escherichia coli]MDB8032682.1 host specificity factor TipJ family phage tail protein [Escherichia coli]
MAGEEQVGNIVYQVQMDVANLIEAQRKVNERLEKMSGGASKAASKFDQLQASINKVAGAIAASLVVDWGKAFLVAADNMSQLNARIERLTGSAAAASQTMQSLMRISSATGGSLQDTAKLWETLSTALRDTGATNGQIIQLTDTLQKIGRIGGSSSEEMANALRQFGQSISSGVVRAEEFNSILEQMPELARQIAAGMGVSIGELRQLMLDGKLTAEDALNAIQKQTGSVNAEFEKLPRTLSQANTALTNSFLSMIDSVNQATGASSGMVAVIDSLTAALDRLTGKTASASAQIHAINIRTNVVHPTDTLVRVKVRATENALGSRERKYNALVTRHTITYNLATQTVDYTLRPSRSFADAVAHTWLIMGEQPVNSIDLYGLYSIAESLTDDRLGYFDYTFDDENDSLGDRVQAICNAASVVAYWDDGVLTFTRDQKVDYPAAVFNRANMKTDEYKISYEATLPGGYDGVQVSYVHPTTNNKTYINYRVLNGAIVEQEAANPNKLEIAGFRNEYQARERALRETKRLIYSRVKMNAKVFEDGIMQVGSVVQIADIYDSNQQQGYITGRAGNSFDTSEPIAFTGSMYVLVTDSLGNPTLRYPAAARADTKYGFTAAIPNIQLNIWNGDTVQLPSRYLIATVEELNSQLWTVNSIKPNSDNTVSLSVAEYSDAIYQ